MTRSVDDPRIAELVRARDSETLQVVVRQYLPQVLRTARSAGLRAQQAEDLAQDTFTTFLETAERFEGRSHVRTWIFGILYRKLSEARRALAKDRRFDDIDDVFEGRFDDQGSWSRPPQAADEALTRKQVRREISDCLEQAPERQRLAFHLREVEQLETDEICKILEVSVTNLGVMLFRARNRLRECLESKGFQGAADAEL
jgi:RNA polymerase sigma-70 factor (ECF subfamily)